MKWRPNVTKEQIAEARDVPLLDYMQQRGYELRREGRYYRMVDHDSLVIDPQRNRWHWNSRDIRSASTPDFLTFYEDKNFEDAVLELIAQQPVIPVSPKPQEKKKATAELVLPKKNETAARVFAYLTKTRGISVRLYQELYRDGLIYESVGHHNAVFVRLKDGQPVGYFARGTLTYGKPFKSCDENSDKSYEFLLPGKAQSDLFVCEAAIDCLSVETLRRLRHQPPCEIPILSLGGNSLVSLDRYIADTPGVCQAWICTDNDQGGNTAWDRICDKYSHLTLHRCSPPEPYKDWNDVLVAIREKRCSLSAADCFFTA